MPNEQPIFGQRCIELACRINHDFYDAIHVAVSRYESADVYAETRSYGGPDFVHVEDFTFDLASLDNGIGERVKCGPLFEVESYPRHAT